MPIGHEKLRFGPQKEKKIRRPGFQVFMPKVTEGPVYLFEILTIDRQNITIKIMCFGQKNTKKYFILFSIIAVP